MTIFQSIILGLIQGVTEFLPVSSSGHLLIPELAFGWAAQGVVFDVVLHVATLLAIVIYFRKRLSDFGRALLQREWTTDKKLAVYIILSIIPVGILGVFDSVTDWFRSTPLVIGSSFIIWGIVLAAADRYGKNNRRTTEQATKRDVLLMSLAQVIALIPGTSRSGITMTAGLFAGLSKRAAAEVSFFMAIPVIAAAGAKQLLDVPAMTIDWGLVSIGFVAAFVSALAGIWFLLRLVERMGYIPFAVYRIAVGIIILTWFV